MTTAPFKRSRTHIVYRFRIDAEAGVAWEDLKSQCTICFWAYGADSVRAFEPSILTTSGAIAPAGSTFWAATRLAAAEGRVGLGVNHAAGFLGLSVILASVPRAALLVLGAYRIRESTAARHKLGFRGVLVVGATLGVRHSAIRPVRARKAGRYGAMVGVVCVDHDLCVLIPCTRDT